MEKITLFLLIAIFPAAICGCAIAERTQQISVLKRLADEQSSMQKYVDAQEQGFNLLAGDIAGNRLSVGISKQLVFEKYFEPIDCREPTKPGEQEVCLFRHPNNFFSDSVYLYFNASGLLDGWKFKPAD
jgi:hypothetical protein